MTNTNIIGDNDPREEFVKAIRLAECKSDNTDIRNLYNWIKRCERQKGYRCFLSEKDMKTYRLDVFDYLK